MAVQLWTSTPGGFQSTPAGDDSPADGDDRIRELKETIGDMLDKEHAFQDQASTAAQGWHREGSAIAYYQAAEPTNRPDGATALDTSDDGRLWVDSDDNALYVYTGSAWSAVAPSGVADLTAAELDQLANIGATTISATQWGYLGVMDQNIRTTDSPTFADVTTTDDVIVGDDLTVTGDAAVGGNLSVTGTITGQRVGSQTSYNASGTEDTLYDILITLVPSNGNKCPMSGGIYQGSSWVMVAYIENVSNVVYARGITTLGGAGSFALSNGSATGTEWALSW